MQDLKDKLTILHTSDGLAFQNHSAEAFDLLRGTITVSNTLYVGFRKPINSLFVSVPTSNTNTGTWSTSYYNGSWLPLDAHFDSPALKTPGFIRWLPPESETQLAVNGIPLYWYRLTSSSGSSTTITGIGPLLCSLSDLSDLDFNLDEDNTSKLKAMVSARNLMVREMQISAWDLLAIHEVSDAAAMYSLFFLYHNRSDRPDDHYSALAQGYLDDYRTLKAKLALTIDRNDNGKVDEGERQTSRFVRFER